LSQEVYIPYDINRWLAAHAFYASLKISHGYFSLGELLNEKNTDAFALKA